jgi:hypothetical protein
LGLVKLRNQLTLAVARGFKSVNLKAAAFDFSDCPQKSGTYFCDLSNLFLNPLQGSLGACAIFEFPTASVFSS